MSKIQKLSWNELYRAKDIDSNIAYQLSEFIDNSISSFESENIDRRTKGDKLNIQIYHNLTDNELHIIDNANGIQCLDEAMTKYNESINKSLLSKNQYGIGMKDAIFWIGKNAKIYTKYYKDNKEMLGTYTHETDEYNIDVVANDVNESFNNMITTPSGTHIVIEDVLNDKTRKIKNYDSLLTTFFGYRYYDYLKKFLEIKINFFDEQKMLFDDPDPIIIEPMSIKDQNCFVLNNDKFLNNFKLAELFNECEEQINKIKDNNSQEYQALEPYFSALINCKKLYIDDYIEFRMPDNTIRKYPIKVCILNEPNQYLCGISIKHSGRFICHPCNNKNKKENYCYKFKNDRLIDGKFRWINIEIDLDSNDVICDDPLTNYIYPDKNKKNLLFKQINSDDFDHYVESFIKKFVPLINILQNINKKLDNKNREKKHEQDNSYGSLFSLSDDNNVYVLNKLNDELSNGKPLKYTIDDRLDVNEPLLKEVPEDNSEYIQYILNSNHYFLNDKNKEDFKYWQENFIALLIILDRYRKNGKYADCTIDTLLEEVKKSLKK